MKQSFAPMLASARSLLGVHLGGPLHGIVRELLDATEAALPERPAAPSKSPARGHLARIPPTALGAAVADLGWYYGYAEHADLADDVAFAHIVGPEGPLVSPTVRLGLTLIGPGILYPDHHHPAAELYLVLSGTAEWSANGTGFVERPPGAVILHPSGVPHAMRTGAETLLALFGWTGAIEVAPIYC